MRKLKIAILSGGISGEREVSLKTGAQIHAALDKKKYRISQYDPKVDLDKFITDLKKIKFDLVIPALHGPFGEDGRIQGLLDLYKTPYLFSGCLASALAMNKYLTKLIVKSRGVTVADDILIKKGDNYNLDEAIKKLSLPIVVKPMELGSSVGISIAKSKNELKKGVVEAFNYGDELLLEQFINGRELTVPIMGNKKPKPLPAIEIVPKLSKWFDYKAKYENGGSDEICPANITKSIQKQLEDLAIIAFKTIGCKDLARADFILEEGTDRLFFLEINTIPGMTSTSLTPKSAKAAGMEFSDFLNKLISNAI